MATLGEQGRDEYFQLIETGRKLCGQLKSFLTDHLEYPKLEELYYRYVGELPAPNDCEKALRAWNVNGYMTYVDVSGRGIRRRYDNEVAYSNTRAYRESLRLPPDKSLEFIRGWWAEEQAMIILIVVDILIAVNVLVVVEILIAVDTLIVVDILIVVDRFLYCLFALFRLAVVGETNTFWYGSGELAPLRNLELSAQELSASPGIGGDLPHIRSGIARPALVGEDSPARDTYF
jgi:hypothetical protein